MTSATFWSNASHTFSACQMEEAELWYRKALRLSSRADRDACLCNLTLLMRADGGRLEEAADLIAR